MLGTPTEMYIYGINFIYILLPIFITAIFVHYVIIPVFYELQIVSTYEVIVVHYTSISRFVLHQAPVRVAGER